MKEIIVSFTGHRPDKIGGYISCPLQDKIKEVIKEKLLSIQPTKAISGMALGVDQLAVQVCLNLGIPVVAACPFEGQEKMWPKEAKDKYHQLLEKCYEIRHIETPGYAPWKMQARNEWMVDHSNILIAVWDGSSGGTKNCVEYAKKKNRDIIYINPKELV